MRQLVNDRNRRNIHRVARVRFERSDPPLAQDHIVISPGHYVFRREQQFFQRRRNPSFHQNRLAHLPQFAQQIKVLHVARPNLQNIHIRQHHRNLRNLHHFADHQQIEFLSRFAQQFQRIFAMPLKRVRRTSRLECPAPQHFRASLRYRFRRRKKLLARFHRARAGHHNHFPPPNADSIRQSYYRSFRTKTFSRELIRRTDAMDFLHSRQQLQNADVEINPRSHRAQHGLPRSSRPVHFEPHLHQVLDHLLNLHFIRNVLHRHNHKKISVSGFLLSPGPTVLSFRAKRGILVPPSSARTRPTRLNHSHPNPTPSPSALPPVPRCLRSEYSAS